MGHHSVLFRIFFKFPVYNYLNLPINSNTHRYTVHNMLLNIKDKGCIYMEVSTEISKELSAKTKVSPDTMIHRFKRAIPMNLSTVTELFKKKEPTAAELERTAVLTRLDDAKKRLDNLRDGYDLQTDFDMVDVYIHALNSVEKEYSHLLKEAKRLEVTKDFALKD